MASKPNFLILGGCGFLGRNLVKYLLDNGVAGQVRVADKKAPFMAFLSADHKAALLGTPDAVECMQVDLSDEDSVDAVFAEPRGGGAWDFVVDLVAETALGKRDEFYAKGVEASAKAGAAALRVGGVRKYVLVSSAAVYKPDRKPSDERARLEPWNAVAVHCLRKEEALRALGGLPLVVLRPALCYGPGDHASLMPRCVIAATYKATSERMDFLWDAEVKTSTVHVFDVVRAIYFCARKAEAGSVFNVADKGDTDQGKLASALGAVFGIETGFVGTIKSNLAALKFDAVVDVANENHLAPWLALLKKHSVANTPLTPYLNKALLAHNHVCIDGAAIEAIGFKYAVPVLTPETLAEQVRQAVAQGIFPSVL